MEIEIKVVSTEIITPSSPTPIDVSNYKLSFLDQMGPPIHTPYTLFYKPTGNNNNLTNSEISSRLKKSLSKTLSLYYPLAGRLVDNSYVNCNDKGVIYIEAEANCKLSDVVVLNIEPIMNELDKLNPHFNDVVNRGACLIVQTTFFSCGGLAIGVAVSHKLCDGWSFSLFANSWAAISRGDDDDDEAHIKSPIFNGAKLIPPRSDIFESDSESRTISKQDIVTKRFIFTPSKINDLRDKYSNTSRATRVEALSAFIWSRFMVSTAQTKEEEEDDLKKTSSLLHVVNIRKRVVPPLPDESFGNFTQPAIAVVSLGNNGVSGVVEKLREAIRSTGGSDYVNSIYAKAEKSSSSTGGEVVPFLFTSLCRFPLYEADFGWGKPVWIGFGSSRHKNVVGFLDSPNEGCIEAWVSLQFEDMAMFKADEEVLAYTTTCMIAS